MCVLNYKMYKKNNKRINKNTFQAVSEVLLTFRIEKHEKIKFEKDDELKKFSSCGNFGNGSYDR